MSLYSVGNIGFADTSRVAKVLAELQGLTVTGPIAGVSQGEVIEIPNLEIEDTLVKAIDMTALEPLDLANFQIVDRRAYGTLTIQTTLADGDYVTIDGKRYTFKDVTDSICYSPAPYEVPVVIGPSGLEDEEVAADALAVAIMSGDSNLYASSFGSTVTVKWRVPGVVGNGKTITTSSGNVTVDAVFAGGTATSGTKILDASTAGKKVLLIWYNKQ